MEDTIAAVLNMRPNLLDESEYENARDPNETYGWRQGGYINALHYEWRAIEMKKNNPMHNPETTKKVSETLQAQYDNGREVWNKGIPNPEQAERMKGDNNPMNRFPEKNPFLGQSFVKGRKWFNNGIENKYLYEHEEVPEGFAKGMLPQIRNKKS